MSDSEEEESPDHQLKLVVLGDGTTGKVSAGPAGSSSPSPRCPEPLPDLRPLATPGSAPEEGAARGGFQSVAQLLSRYLAGCSPSAPGPARETRALPVAIRAVLGSQTLWQGFRTRGGIVNK
ncbi:hypothetical protein Nmel_007312 [Mimus melanotis]